MLGPKMLRPFAWALKFVGSQGGGTAVEVHCYPHYYVTAVTIDTTVTAVYLTVLRQQWPRQHCDGDGSNIRVSAMQNDNATTTMKMTTL